MNRAPGQEIHEALNARFLEVDGQGTPAQYGNVSAEYAAVQESAGVLDLSGRGRLCLLGADRQRFLHGQVTNDVNRLQIGEGCYAALVTAKGKMVSDLNVYRLTEEILLDFEPGYTQKIFDRLSHFIIADDVQIIDAAPHYGLLSVQGPRAAEVIRETYRGLAVPEKPWSFVRCQNDAPGEIYVMNHPRTGSAGFDVFIPTDGRQREMAKLKQDYTDAV